MTFGLGQRALKWVVERQRQLGGLYDITMSRTQESRVPCLRPALPWLPVVSSRVPLASRPVRAVVCNELGPPSVLRVEERPDPEPGPGQVAVAVEAAGVNFVDGLFVAGQYQIKPSIPFVPGSEVAGHVVAMGPDVSGLAVGDRVLASVGLGGFASRVVVAAGTAVALPEGLDAARAATFTQSYSTCLFALRDRAHAAPGETVLVLGAGGGVGLAAVGVALALGCRVLGVASSADKRQAALDAGADSVLDPAAESVKDVARAWAGGTGVDLVVDPIGGALAEPSLRALGDRGRYLVIGFASGDIPSVPLNQILLRNRSVVGIDWGIWAMTHSAEQRALLADLLAMVAAGHSTLSVPSSTRSTMWRAHSRICWAGGPWGRSPSSPKNRAQRCCPALSWHNSARRAGGSCETDGVEQGVDGRRPQGLVMAI